MSVILVFPNTLYAQVPVAGFDHVYVVEEPLYFRAANLKPHKLKLAYMRACMMAWYKQFKKPGVSYIEYDSVGDYEFLKSAEEITFYDPLDVMLVTKLTKIAKRLKLKVTIWRDLPNFIATADDLESYARRKTYSHKTFYDAMKKKEDVLTGWKNMDKENRSALPISTTVPAPPLYSPGPFRKEAIEYIQAHPKFKDHVGECDAKPVGNAKGLHVLRGYPVTFAEAKEHLVDFIKNRLHDFGKYQDAIVEDHVLLFHSGLSCVLNNGLLLPRDVVQEVLMYAEAHEIPENSTEGFIRQVLGWREYMRFVYTVVGRDEEAGAGATGATEAAGVTEANHWKAERKLNWDVWHGKLPSGLTPLDVEIKKCIDNAYSHHIVRLMIFLNVFIMCKVHPDEVIRWFMECCAIDAYPWVMWSNIYAMGWFDPRFMKKPYISTSRYVLTMSDYGKGDWMAVWDSMFYGFIHTNESLFTGSSRIYMRNLKAFKDKSKEDRNAILKRYEIIVNTLTTK